MANERGGNDRRTMTISVTLLGVTLCVVFFAYFTFSQIYNDVDASTVEFATVVSSINYFKNFASTHLCKRFGFKLILVIVWFLFRFSGMGSAHQLVSTQTIHIAISRGKEVMEHWHWYDFFRVKILPRSPNVILKYLLPMFRKVHYRHIIKEWSYGNGINGSYLRMDFITPMKCMWGAAQLKDVWWQLKVFWLVSYHRLMINITCQSHGNLLL